MSVEVQPIFSCSLFRMIIIQSNRGITYFQEVGKMYVVTIERCIRSENCPLREIGTWEKVRYNGGCIVHGVRCNATQL